MDIYRIQQLAGLQPVAKLVESVDEILEEAKFNPPDDIKKRVAGLGSSWKPKVYADTIDSIFSDFTDKKKSDEKWLQKQLFKEFNTNVLPDSKHTLSDALTTVADKPRLFTFKVETPLRAMIMKTLFANLGEALKAVGIVLRFKIDSKALAKEYAADSHLKRKYTIEFSLYTAEELKASKEEQQKAKEEEANPKSEEEKKSDSEKNMKDVEEIFKRTMKFKHPDFHKVKKRDEVLEEYFDKVVTTMHILGNFVHAGPAVLNNIKETYKGEDITTLVKDVEDMQALIKKFEEELGKLVEPSAKEYVKSR